MIKSYNCLVKLIPTGKFYFGGEIGHKSRGRAEALTSYIVRSQIFPQQTTLLGALRYALWQISGKDLKDAPIGDTSFDLDNPSETKNFGCIKSISELYVYHSNQYYWSQPSYNNLAFDGKVLKDLDTKNHPPQYFVSHSNAKTQDTLFQKSEQVGVIAHASKKRWQLDEDEAFYRQSFYQFKSPDDGFAFLAVLDEISKADFINKSLLMPVGGENTLFKVSIENIPDNFKQPVFKNEDIGHKIILTSDALLSNETVDTAEFVISDTVDFRFLKTHRKETVAWSDLQKDDRKSPRFSQKYELFKRGSVFYFSEKSKANTFVEALENQIAMRQIGYNQYVFQ
jgi:CRISPR-associated protein Cmr3